MSRHEDTTARAKRILVQRLEGLQRSGVEILRRASVDPPQERASNLLESLESVAAPAGEEREMERSIEQTKKVLAGLEQEVKTCTLCGELAAGRTQTVFGVGDAHARLCFFGEAPGADEDRQGEPFVGRAGRLLTDMIQKGMGLRREDVYILNVIKCRPPGNRNPNNEEIANCRPFFERQLEIIAPDFICCLGSVAARTLLDTKQSVGRLRGVMHDYRGIATLVTYHPAYLLRNPNAKKDTWQDLQILMREMGLPAK